MIQWQLAYLEEAQNDLDRLDGAVRSQVLSAITKVAKNPLPQQEGGLGKPLGNKGGYALAGYLKIVLMKAGIRVVYKLIRQNEIMVIIVISVRSDSEVYKIAADRSKKQ
jgi:mRNA interferase RelE/StbE